MSVAPGPALIHLDLRPASLQWVLPYEGQDDRNELLCPLHHERMARSRSGKQLIARAGDPLGDCLTLPGWRKEVLLSGDHKCRGADPGQPIQRVVLLVCLPL